MNEPETPPFPSSRVVEHVRLALLAVLEWVMWKPSPGEATSGELKMTKVEPPPDPEKPPWA